LIEQYSTTMLLEQLVNVPPGGG